MSEENAKSSQNLLSIHISGVGKAGNKIIDYYIRDNMAGKYQNKFKLSFSMFNTSISDLFATTQISDLVNSQIERETPITMIKEDILAKHIVGRPDIQTIGTGGDMFIGKYTIVDEISKLVRMEFPNFSNKNRVYMSNQRGINQEYHEKKPVYPLENAKNTELTLFISSLAGGTGGGTTPELMRLIKTADELPESPSKLVGQLALFPYDKEMNSGFVCFNTLNALVHSLRTSDFVLLIENSMIERTFKPQVYKYRSVMIGNREESQVIFDNKRKTNENLLDAINQPIIDILNSLFLNFSYSKFDESQQILNAIRWARRNSIIQEKEQFNSTVLVPCYGAYNPTKLSDKLREEAKKNLNRDTLDNVDLNEDIDLELMIHLETVFEKPLAKCEPGSAEAAIILLYGNLIPDMQIINRTIQMTNKHGIKRIKQLVSLDDDDDYVRIIVLLVDPILDNLEEMYTKAEDWLKVANKKYEDFNTEIYELANVIG
ncbi:MAG: hypothetical protein INQ03_15755 [Candidatus Heimdallarchaeota archaeon]|nr:hypothetical protein [Candidatus Heimdallarchaeota archaeon]